MIVAGSAKFTHAQAREMIANMDLGNWEIWLQPVAWGTDGRVEFHEALARFGAGPRRMASRADFFVAGRADGLLARFDRMMLLRALELMAAHPLLRISVNVAYETFVSDSFPTSFLGPRKDLSAGCERLILEYVKFDELVARYVDAELIEDGVDLFQGELLGMPRPAAEVLASCADGRSTSAPAADLPTAGVATLSLKPGA